jgi:hypothetical protein
MFHPAELLPAHLDSWPRQVGQLPGEHGTTTDSGRGLSHSRLARESIGKAANLLGNTVIPCRIGDPA